jgi:glycosyltransferase involved in cell wall biosynthesis
MISIIVSSHRPVQFSAFSKSLSSTIGVPYELIQIDNPSTMGLCEAYNAGAQKAKYDILCFVHEDIQFITDKWGLKLLSHFQSDENIGVVSVAGSVCKSKMPSGWWQPAENNTEPKRMNIIQQSRYQGGAQVHDYINPFNEKKSLVATLDGVFLAVHKKVWEKNKFDETLLKGFHGYDIDFTINVGRTRNNYVVYDVLISHQSEGNMNLDWFRSVFEVHKKWRRLLPIVKSDAVTNTELKMMDRYWFDFLFSIPTKTRKERKQKLGLYTKLLSFFGLGAITLNDLKRFKILLQQLNHS